MGRYDALTSLKLNTEPPPPVTPVTKKRGSSSAAHGDTAASVAADAASKRSLLRRSFDFYEDQIAYLTRVSLESQLAGQEGSMNAMVRQAVDYYIQKKKAAMK